MSKSDEIIYEQAHWNPEHVQRIYRNLNGIIVADGQWQKYPLQNNQIGYYRVFQEQYFQAIYSVTDVEQNRLLREVLAMDALPTQHDAEWSVSLLKEIADGEPAYEVTSRFAYTPGPFPYQREVDKWLNRHGLGLNSPDGLKVQGYAYFEEMTPECFLDAIERLHWLEAVIAEVNRQVHIISKKVWDVYSEKSRAQIAEFEQVNGADSTDLVAVPPIYIKIGWKSREPID